VSPLILAAPLIGLLLALFGAGGGMVTVPLLIHGLSLSIKPAIAASLWIVASVSLVTLVRKRAWQVLNLKLLVVFVLGGGIGSWLGARLGLAMPDNLQALLFGGLVLFVAWRMRIPPRDCKPATAAVACPCLKAFVVAVVMGLVTGVFGVGGGFLIVPALIWLGISAFPVAVAHSLVVIVINACVAGVSMLGDVSLPVMPLIYVSLLAAVGSMIGCYLCKYLPEQILYVWFSRLLFVIGLFMIAGSMMAFISVCR